MALLKTRASKALPTRAISYIMNPTKSECSDTINLLGNAPYSKQFQDTARLYNNKYDKADSRKYYHFKLNYDPGDNIKNGGRMTANNVLDMAREFTEKAFPGYEAVISVHGDKPHLHAHIIINAVSVETGNMLHINDRTQRKYKDLAQQITSEHGFTAIDWRKATKEKREATKAVEVVPEKPREYSQNEKYIIERLGKGAKFKEYSWKEQLRDDISSALRKSATKEEFVSLLYQKGIQLSRSTDKTISFIAQGQNKAIRGERLGADYTAASIADTIKANAAARAAEKTIPARMSDIISKYNIEQKQDISAEIEKKMKDVTDRYNKTKREVWTLARRNTTAKRVARYLNDYINGTAEHKAAILEQLKTFNIDPDKITAVDINAVITERTAVIAEKDRELEQLMQERRELRELQRATDEVNKEKQKEDDHQNIDGRDETI
jgi:hypothetical protein